MSLLGKKWPVPVGMFSLSLQFNAVGRWEVKSLITNDESFIAKPMFPFFAAGMF
jgi:hypothetical protein